MKGLIESIARIGKFALEIENKSAIEQLIENPAYPYCFFILLDEHDGQILYKGIDYEEVSVDYKKYLFRSGSSRGANFSPTAKVTTLSNTFEQKILGWFKSIIKDKKAPHTDIFKKMYDLLLKLKETIVSDLEEKMDTVQENILLSIKLNNTYLFDSPIFTEAFSYLVHKKDFEVSESHQICSICNKEKSTVIGKMSVFKFYTLDKPGFISGGFQEENAWRNYPVCMECKSFVEAGRQFVEENLQYQFYGIPYLLIPTFLLDREEIEEDNEILDILLNQKKHIQLSKEHGNSLMTDEGDLLEVLSEQKNTMAFHLLFLQKQQSAERILLIIDDILPSRLQRLFEVKSEIEKTILYRKDQKEPGHFHLGFFRTFFSKSDDGKRNYDLNKYFLTIVESIFKNKPLRFDFLLKFMMKEIRKSFVQQNEEAFYWKIKQAMACIMFLEKIGVLNMKGGPKAMSKFDSLFEDFSQQLNTNEKKAIFLLGTLTQILLEIQQKERGSKPFMKQLMGLKMDEGTIKALLPKVINKLEEYEAYTKSRRFLAEEISLLFMKSSDQWKISVDQLNYYFVCGMSLAPRVKEILYEKEEVSVNA
ncbi:TIGR02556 family CRISPR-associated protein [Bacillus alveayuensis]|uniref:TIGR02556 family CRISPR-associated protein n=1 Tax=Aeribacillus alveayuensis TaxID=279215 RepID=UPI000AD602B8